MPSCAQAFVNFKAEKAKFCGGQNSVFTVFGACLILKNILYKKYRFFANRLLQKRVDYVRLIVYLICILWERLGGCAE